MIPLSAYVAVEQALIKRLVGAWRPEASAAFATISTAIATGQFAKARAVASALDLTPTVQAHQQFIKYTLYAAAKFGSKMANPGDSSLTLQAYENLLNRAYNTLLLYVVHQGNGFIRDRALQSIAAFEAQTQKWEAEAHPLYVRRDVLNSEAIIAWAKAQGFTSTLEPDDMHVTLVYSKEPVDWTAVPDGINPLRHEKLHFMGGLREMDLLGPKQDIAVLKITSHLLQSNWRQWREAGASWDFPSYQPHVTISYHTPEGLDVKAITPYSGPIDLGPEIFETLDENWKDGLTEKWEEEQHPRVPAGSAEGGEFAPGTRFYHGTVETLLPGILNEGLHVSLPNANWIKRYPGYYQGKQGEQVFVTTAKSKAEMYASKAADTRGKMINGKLVQPVPIVLHVSLPKEEQRRLLPDPNEIGGNAFGYSGVIKPEWIKSYDRYTYDEDGTEHKQHLKVKGDADLYVVLVCLPDEAQKDEALSLPEQVTAPDHTRFVKDFVSFADAGDRALQLIASLHTSRLAAWGFTTEADVLGITEYQLKATLDNRTSKFCRLVANGRRFKVQDARNKLIEVLSATDPADLKVLQPWPDQSKDAIADYQSMSNQELADLGLLIPPFHPLCRTLLARVGTEYPEEGTVDEGVPLDEELPDPEVQAQNEEAVVLGQNDLTPGDGEPLPSIIEASAFAALGINLTDPELQAWNELLGLDPVVVFAMLDGVDPQDLLDELVSLGIEIDDAGDLTLGAEGPLAGEGTNVNASHLYDPATGTLYQTFIDFKQANPEQARAYLISVYAGLVELGDTLDATSIEFQATSDTVGAAAVWGAAPVEQDAWDSFRQYAADNIAPDGELSEIDDALDENQKAVVFDLLSVDDPLAAVALAALPFEVNGMSLADALFVGQSWIAEVDLTDPHTVERFKAFFSMV